MKRLMVMIFGLIALGPKASAQCAMCRSTLENNFSNGDPGIAAGINTGILYLLVLPYLAAAVIVFLWFKTTKNDNKNIGRGIA